MIAVVIGIVWKLQDIAVEQAEIHKHIDSARLDAGQVTALIAEATGIARKAAGE